MSESAKNREYSKTALLSFSLSSSKAKKVSQYTLDGTYIKTWRNVSEAARSLNVNRTNIAACARGKYKKSSGFKWVYNDELITDKLPKLEPKVKLPKPPMSEEIKKKISETNKLRWAENPEKRRLASINNHKNKIILQYDKEMNFIAEFISVAEAARAVGASTRTNIAKCARGLRKTSNKFIWKYKENIK